jgi:hypothetical protein
LTVMVWGSAMTGGGACHDRRIWPAISGAIRSEPAAGGHIA